MRLGDVRVLGWGTELGDCKGTELGGARILWVVRVRGWRSSVMVLGM